jgi:hypothetical protein
MSVFCTDRRNVIMPLTCGFAAFDVPFCSFRSTEYTRLRRTSKRAVTFADWDKSDMPNNLIDPTVLYSLLLSAPNGLTPSEIEFALGLATNSVDYHLRRKAFIKNKDGRYVLTSKDEETFLALGGYRLVGTRAVIPVAKKVTYPFEPMPSAEWKTPLDTLADLFIQLKALGAKLQNATEPTSANNLRLLLAYSDMLRYYVDAVCSDPRYGDEEAQEFILEVPIAR